MTTDEGPWMPVPDTNGRYECSPAGVVRRINGNVAALKPHWSMHGYLRVAFYIPRPDGGNPRTSRMLHDVIGSAWGPPLMEGEAYGLLDDSDRANVGRDNVTTRKIKAKR